MSIRLHQSAGVRFGAWLCGLGALAAAAEEPSSKVETFRVEPVVIEAQPLEIKPGEPMSRMALVTQPAKLTGALSWTVETRQHRGRLTSLALSPDFQRAATGGVDGAIHIWDLATGKLLRVIVGQDSHILSLSWSPDGNTIASGGRGDSRIRLWDARSGMPLRAFRSPSGYVHFVRWSPDGKRLLAAGGRSGWIWAWEAKTDKERVVLETGQDVRSIDWSSNNTHVAVSITQGVVSIVDVTTAKVVQVLDDPNTAHHCVRWSPNGKKLFVGSAGQSVIYEMPEGKELETIPIVAFNAVWSPDGETLCTASNGGKARFWGATARKKPKRMLLNGSELHWPRPEQIFALDDTTITASNADTGAQLFQHVVARTMPPLWTPNKPIVTGLRTPKLVVWDNVTAEKLHTLEGHTGDVAAISWNRDGKLLASGGEDKTVRLWEMSSGKLLETLTDHTSAVLDVAWSSDGKILASAGYDHVIRLWQPSGKPIGTLEGHTVGITALAWAPRGNLLASGSSDGTIRLWRVDRKQSSATILAGKPVEILAFSPDGSTLASGLSEGFVQLWQTSNGRPLYRRNLDQRRTSGGVNALSWSPDGRKMLVACQSRHSVDLWDLQTSELERLDTETRGQYVAWSPNGARMVAGTRDSIVQFWEGHEPKLSGLIFDEMDHIVLLSTGGNYRIDPSFQPQFLFVLQAEKEQLMLSVPEFEAKYSWKNVPTQVTFTK